MRRGFAVGCIQVSRVGCWVFRLISVWIFQQCRREMFFARLETRLSILPGVSVRRCRRGARDATLKDAKGSGKVGAGPR